MVLTIVLAARHKRAHPALTPAGEGWYSIYLPREDGRLSWSRCLITRWPEIEPMTARSEVRRPRLPLRHRDTDHITRSHSVARQCSTTHWKLWTNWAQRSCHIIHRPTARTWHPVTTGQWSKWYEYQFSECFLTSIATAYHFSPLWYWFAMIGLTLLNIIIAGRMNNRRGTYI